MTEANRQSAATAERNAALAAWGETLDLQRLGHHGGTLSKLAFMRDAADYTPARPASATEAAEAVALARSFLQAARVLPR